MDKPALRSKIVYSKELTALEKRYLLELMMTKQAESNSESDWIPCSERMPDEDSYKWAVGITSTGRCIAFQEHNAYENDTGGISVPTYLAHGSEITHWMPIPEPPGGDNNA